MSENNPESKKEDYVIMSNEEEDKQENYQTSEIFKITNIMSIPENSRNSSITNLPKTNTNENIILININIGNNDIKKKEIQEKKNDKLNPTNLHSNSNNQENKDSMAGVLNPEMIEEQKQLNYSSKTSIKEIEKSPKNIMNNTSQTINNVPRITHNTRNTRNIRNTGNIINCL